MDLCCVPVILPKVNKYNNGYYELETLMIMLKTAFKVHGQGIAI